MYEYCCHLEPGNTNRLNINALVPFKYEDPIRKMILQFKYYYNFKHCRFFAYHMSKAINLYLNHCLYKEVILVPVPLSSEKLFQRGYNQAFILCEYISKYIENVNIELLLVKNQNISQKDSRYMDRFGNSNNIILCDNVDFSIINNKCIILIDDVIASGATVNQCIQELESMNYKYRLNNHIIVSAISII